MASIVDDTSYSISIVAACQLFLDVFTRNFVRSHKTNACIVCIFLIVLITNFLMCGSLSFHLYGALKILDD